MKTLAFRLLINLYLDDCDSAVMGCRLWDDCERDVIDGVEVGYGGVATAVGEGVWLPWEVAGGVNSISRRMIASEGFIQESNLRESGKQRGKRKPEKEIARKCGKKRGEEVW